MKQIIFILTVIFICLPAHSQTQNDEFIEYNFVDQTYLTADELVNKSPSYYNFMDIEPDAVVDLWLTENNQVNFLILLIRKAVYSGKLEQTKEVEIEAIDI